MKRSLSFILSILFVISFSTACSTPQKPLTIAELLNLGKKYLIDLEYHEAIVAFTAVIEVDPRNFDAHIGLGDTYVSLGDFENAIIAYEAAISIDSANEMPYIKMAQVYVGHEDFERAIFVLDRGNKLCGSIGIVQMLNELNQRIIASIKTDFYLIDYGMLVAAMHKEDRDFSWNDVSSYLRDTDDNGYLDLVMDFVEYRDSGRYNCITRLSYDGNRIGIRFDGHGGAAGNNSLCYLPQSDEFICKFGYYSAGYHASLHRAFWGLDWKNELTGVEGPLDSVDKSQARMFAQSAMQRIWIAATKEAVVLA